MMRSVDRIRATLEGRDVDRPAYSFWTHFPGIDLDPPAIAAATVDFARPLGLDFVKAMPNGLYAVEDWGVVPDFSAIAAGGVAGYVFAELASSYVENMRLPGALPVMGSAIVLAVAAVVASLMPASRAARVDVLQALRSE